MARFFDSRATQARTHLVTVEPIKGRRQWEHAWCTCGAERDFTVDGFAEDWALTHPAELEARADWVASKAS
jgi:hypothetical protein